MTNLTLRQLSYCDALARHGHFGRAAEACAISQPALSMQIKELEQTLGMALFERSGRKVSLTGFGEVFAERAREVLRAVDELEALARTAQDGLAGPLRIGVIPTVAPYLLPRIVGRLAGLYPDLDIRIRESITPTLIRELSEGRLDAAIVALPVSEAHLDETALFSESFVLVRPLEDAGRPVPDPDVLARMKLLLLEEGHCFREQALSFCGADAPRPRELMDGSSLSTLVQMVGAGIGVTLIPEMAVPVETRSAPVSVAAFAPPQPSRTIGMIWRRTSPIAPQLRRIAEAIEDLRPIS
ncbi:LysR substrate-binding domain-containing protein [Salinarimonas ramus]|uniref:LysR family transcriptional regulator n=1 Tax=Salinarimonas ramus TaxID=690164 RepID=A0A917QFW8_9HYPH|nr:LysR substrate-binding domain-containing protein [Salinarimonas ramus]GGK48762.1 LysR family transcriptional regulator [Salinarimonas ramus]